MLTKGNHLCAVFYLTLNTLILSLMCTVMVRLPSPHLILYKLTWAHMEDMPP